MLSTSSDDSSPSRSTDSDVAFVGDRIVVPVVEGESSHARSTALDIASETRSELTVAKLDVPETGSGGDNRTAEGNTGHGRVDSQLEDASTGTVTGSGRTVVDAIEDAVRKPSGSTIVLENGHRVDFTDLFLGETTTRLANRLGSNVFVVTEATRREPISSILVPIGGGPYSELAVSLAEVMARAHDAWIDVYHVVDPDSSSESRQRAEQYVRSCADRLDDFERVDTWIQEASNVSEAIIEQTEYYDLTVLGSPSKGRLQRFLFGSTTDAVTTEARNPVITVRGP